MKAVALVALIPAIAVAEPAKKDLALKAKSTQHAGAPRPGAKPAHVVNLYNGWTDEWLAVEPGTRIPQATLDRFLRDHYTNQPGTMEPRLADILLSAADHFKSDRVIVVSGFRHPKYNLLLRKKGHQVARDSQHTHGNAVDFNIPKVTTEALHAWAKDQKIGGVGLYLQSGFVHMDTGPVRYWSGE